MKSSSQCRCFKIGGNNVNGASCQGKMAQILTFARSFDIFCFQDTRLVSDPLQGDPSLPGSSNPALWKGQHFFLQGKASTTGLLIVVSPSSPAKLLVYHPPLATLSLRAVTSDLTLFSRTSPTACTISTCPLTRNKGLHSYPLSTG